MFPNPNDVEEAVITLLAPLKPQRNILPRAFPDQIDQDIVPVSGLGICLVAIQSGSATPPTNKQFSVQTQTATLDLELVLIQRGNKTHKHAYGTIQLIINLLAGQRPLTDKAYGNLFFKDFSYSGMTKEDMCWIYTIRFGIPYKFTAGNCDAC